MAGYFIRVSTRIFPGNYPGYDPYARFDTRVHPTENTHPRVLNMPLQGFRSLRPAMWGGGGVCFFVLEAWAGAGGGAAGVPHVYDQLSLCGVGCVHLEVLEYEYNSSITTW